MKRAVGHPAAVDRSKPRRWRVRRASAMVLAGAMVGAPLGGLVSRTPAQALTTTQISVPVTADAQVKSKAPTTNYGTSTTLTVSSTVRSYLLFAVSGLSGPTPAKLRVFTGDTSPGAVSLYVTSSSWAEQGISWSTAPAVSGTPKAVAFPSAVGKWTTFNLGSLDVGVYTFALVSSSGDAVQFSSREGLNPPVLVLTPTDMTPPSVSVTQPAMSATVAGTTTLVASASDNVKVSRVVFYRSTTPISVATLSGPSIYSLSWNTTALPNGCYVIYAQAYDSAGNVSESSGVVVMVKNGVVPKPPKPVADFSAPTTTGTAPQNISFVDKSSASPVCWVWDFGDGTRAVSQNPQHIYSAPGVYTVGLTAYNAGGKSTLTRAGYIVISGYPRAGRRPGPTRVLIIGDSITTQYYGAAASLLQGLGYATSTWNFPGTGILDKVRYHTTWLDDLISAKDPDKVVIEFAGNLGFVEPFDPSLVWGSAAFYAAWAGEATADTARLRARGALVYWMLAPRALSAPMSEIIPNVNSIYDGLDTGVVDCFTPFGGATPDPALRSPEGLHLNQRGIILMANTTTATITGVPVLRKLQVTPTNPSLPAGTTQQLRATGTYTNGSTADLTAAVTWSSSDPSVASVDAGGLATGVAPGSVTVTATSGTVTAVAYLEVAAAELVPRASIRRVL
jgi:PKD repeat protein